MGRRRENYPPAFRVSAVELVASSGKPIAVIARELGVHEGTLSNWVGRARANEEKSDELTEPEKHELEALRKETKRLRMEREILKRAVVFWVKESSE